MSKKHAVEVVVHVEEALAEGRRQMIVDKLQDQSGVDHAHFTPGRPHLMVIDYDPSEVHALDVLGYVRQERLGASLVGGI